MARFNHKKDYEKTGMQVEVKNNDVNRALRKLKKKIAEDGLMQDLRRREFFESKGTKEAAIRRYKKQRAKEQDNW